MTSPICHHCPMESIESSQSNKTESTENVKKAIRHIWNFLKDYIEFTNTHGAEFISDKHWDRFVSPSIQTELLSMDRTELRSLPLGGSNCHQQGCQDNDLTVFVKAATSCHLENLHVLSDSPAIEELAFKGVVAESMSEKKLHEVEIMANAVAGMVHDCHCDLVMDIGSGKGYLSLELAGHHGLNVLGLDACQGNTHGAQHRKEKLNSRWTALVTKTDNDDHIGHGKGNIKKSSDHDTELVSGKDVKVTDRYIPVTLFVTPDMNLSSVLSQHAIGLCPRQGPDHARTVIAGLHTCGSLAVSAIRLFIADPRAAGLCLVGCCYQLMQEEEEEDSFHQDQLEAHFPLSEFGKSMELRLGRNARNLASQSIHRIAESGQLQGEEFYWRALLDVVIQKLEIPHPERIMGIRGLNRRSSSFTDYVRKAFQKLGFPMDSVTPEFISQTETAFQCEQAKMAACFQLKLALAPAVEALVLLDRLLFLMEQPCVQEASLVRLFDPVASPRCYAIFASKTSNG